MTTEEIRSIVEHFGEASQIDKAIEEMGELIAVLIQHRAGRRTVGDVINEVADVSVMIAQLRFIFGAEAIDVTVQLKRRRLHARIHDGTVPTQDAGLLGEVHAALGWHGGTRADALAEIRRLATP